MGNNNETLKAKNDNVTNDKPKTKEDNAILDIIPSLQLKEVCDLFAEDYEGFELFESIIDGVHNLNPKSQARKDIFLTETTNQKEREHLRNKLQMWFDLIRNSESVQDMVTVAQENVDEAKNLLKENLKKALKETRVLEQGYRATSLFYRNTKKDKVKNITILNAKLESLTDLEDKVNDKIKEELTLYHDRLDLKQNYSMLVLPGFLGSNMVLKEWAQIAHKNKVMLITDFDNLTTPSKVIKEFDNAQLTGGDIYRSNVIMTSNWLVGRDKYQELEEEDFFLPPSTALAGTIHKTLIAQPTAGKTYGGIDGVKGVRFPLKKSEISELEKRGLIPMVKEWEQVMAFSAKTLYTGDDVGLQTYSVVRVFDYIGKVIIDFLNRQAFINFTPLEQDKLRREIIKYLESIKGSDKIIQNFKVGDISQHPVTRAISIPLHITPFFPAKSFVVNLGGTKGDSFDQWQLDYKEVKS